jgi:hypothetical protein
MGMIEGHVDVAATNGVQWGSRLPLNADCCLVALPRARAQVGVTGVWV